MLSFFFILSHFFSPFFPSRWMNGFPCFASFILELLLFHARSRFLWQYSLPQSICAQNLAALLGINALANNHRLFTIFDSIIECHVIVSITIHAFFFPLQLNHHLFHVHNSCRLLLSLSFALSNTKYLRWHYFVTIFCARQSIGFSDIEHLPSADGVSQQMTGKNIAWNTIRHRLSGWLKLFHVFFFTFVWFLLPTQTMPLILIVMDSQNSHCHNFSFLFSPIGSW